MSGLLVAMPMALRSSTASADEPKAGAPSALPALPPAPPSAPTPTGSAAPTTPPAAPAAPNANSGSEIGSLDDADKHAMPAPPMYVEAPAPEPKHAPHTAFWIGGRLGVMGFGGSFFVNDRKSEESTGNFVLAGGSLEANVGARLNKRYIPYMLLEYAQLEPGHRFDSGTEATSTLIGLGFRFVIGNVDRAGIMADLSLAQRTVMVRSNGETFKMRGPELFRLGLGAEIRLTNHFALSPMAHLTGGTMEQSDGMVHYAPNQGDQQTQPTYIDGSLSRSQKPYLVAGVGCGGHFDLFGK